MTPARNKPRTGQKKPRNDSARALTQEQRAAAAQRDVERLDRQIFRAVQAWAKLWEECPNAGCRRNACCLQEDACRMHSDEPLTAEDCDAIRAWLAAGTPKYDGVKVR